MEVKLPQKVVEAVEVKLPQKLPRYFFHSNLEREESRKLWKLNFHRANTPGSTYLVSHPDLCLTWHLVQIFHTLLVFGIFLRVHLYQ